MYRTTLIMTKKILELSRIFNFHPGSLLTNRGAHPIERAILNNEKYTEMSLHEINEKIDSGLLIDKVKIPIKIRDNSLTLMEKMEKMEESIDQLLISLYNYLNGKITPVSINKGKYYRKISEVDYTININIDSISQIYNKIRSQYIFKGAILQYKEKKYYMYSVN